MSTAEEFFKPDTALPAIHSEQLCEDAQIGSIPESTLRRVHEQYCNADGLIPGPILLHPLRDLNIVPAAPKVVSRLVSCLSNSARGLSFEELKLLCHSLQGSLLPGADGRFLSHRRLYLETGRLETSEVIKAYTRRLEEHRRMCEGSGRYNEADAAAKRLLGLRTAQVQRLRTELLEKQEAELSELEESFSDHLYRFHVTWQACITSHDRMAIQQFTALTAEHAQQRAEMIEDLEARRPRKPQNSKDYLNQRKIEVSLAKLQDYNRAHQVKKAADNLYAVDMEQTQAMYDTEIKLKLAKLDAKHLQEVESLQQRSTRMRDELCIKRQEEKDQLLLRRRNTTAELQTLHRLEVVHLENFAEGQAQAGKFEFLPDNYFRRKQELMATQMIT